MTREEHIQAKWDALNDLTMQQKKHLKIIRRMCNYPETKRINIMLKRMFKLYGHAIAIKMLEHQKLIVRSQPLKPPEGLPLSIVGGVSNTGPEEIMPQHLLPKGKIIKLK